MYQKGNEKLMRVNEGWVGLFVKGPIVILSYLLMKSSLTCFDIISYCCSLNWEYKGQILILKNNRIHLLGET